MPSWEDMEPLGLTKTIRMRLARQDDPVASYYELCDQKAGGAEENEDEDVTLLPIQP